MKCVCLALTVRLDEFYGSSSGFSVSSYQLLGWTRLNGPMCVCAHQNPGWVHKSDLEQPQSIYVFASFGVSRLVMCGFCIKRSVGWVLLVLSSICSMLVSTARLDESQWPDACVCVRMSVLVGCSSRVWLQDSIMTHIILITQISHVKTSVGLVSVWLLI